MTDLILLPISVVRLPLSITASVKVGIRLDLWAALRVLILVVLLDLSSRDTPKFGSGLGVSAQWLLS